MTPAAASRTALVFGWAAMILAIAYVIVDVVLQFLPPHYSVVSDAESDLAVGPLGWAMRANFAARGVMSACIVAGVLLTARRPLRGRITAGCTLIAVAGACSMALVFFDTDVNAPGQFGMSQHTDTGRSHVIFATIGFVSVLLGMLLLTSALRLGRAALRCAVIAVVGLLTLAGCLLFAPQLVGLAERLCLLGILSWAFAVGLRVVTGPAR